jgi:multiple sugar transport system ATP-binding protein
MSDVNLQNVSKRFGAKTVLESLDLQIRRGEFVTLLGPSGCGKSTLLRIIAGLEEPDSGCVNLDNCDITKLQPADRDVAMVFQSYALYPHLSVLDNISTPLRMRQLRFVQRLPGARLLSSRVRQIEQVIHEQAQAAAATVGLDQQLGSKPAQLSGGQRQRVALARALVRHPKVFLFDEPLSNLDASLRHSLRAEIRALHQRLGITFIYVTHDQQEAMTLSDRVALMQDGKVLQFDQPQVLYHRPANLEVARFIGTPKINLLPVQQSATGSLRVADQVLGVSQESVGFVGVRPQSIQFGAESGLRLSGHILESEFNGEEWLVKFRMPSCETPLSVVMPAARGTPRVGDCLQMVVPADRVLLFRTSGQLIGTLNELGEGQDATVLEAMPEGGV